MALSLQDARQGGEANTQNETKQNNTLFSPPVLYYTLQTAQFTVLPFSAVNPQTLMFSVSFTPYAS